MRNMVRASAEVAVAERDNKIAQLTEHGEVHTIQFRGCRFSAHGTDRVDHRHIRAVRLPDRAGRQARFTGRRHLCVRSASFSDYLGASTHSGASRRSQPGEAFPGAQIDL